jgi:energy-coupling factor transporter ATP-binding protein EcfA2
LNSLHQGRAWAWENIGREFAKDKGSEVFRLVFNPIAKTLREKWEHFEWKKASNAYRLRMRERYNKVTILGKSEAVSLEGIFTDVFLLDKLSAERYADLLSLKQDPQVIERNTNRYDALKLIQDEKNRRLMILGKPGAGKTTFLKHLIMLSTDGRINLVPIYVSLKEWADSRHDLQLEGLTNYISEQFDICGFPEASKFIEYVLRSGQALVLFDGLDEVNQDNNYRSTVIQTVQTFNDKFNQGQCVITCRVAANEYQFAQFKYAEVADFSESQVHQFIDKWFKYDAKIRAGFLSEFEKVPNRGLRDLAKSPILLSLVCLAYEETSELPPNRRVEVYRQAVDALMRKWDAIRDIKRVSAYDELSLSQKEALISQVAALTFENGDYFFRRQTLADVIEDCLKRIIRQNQTLAGDGNAVLRVIAAHNGIWVERAHDVYSFSHLSLQEYFAANYVVRSAGSGALRRLLSPQHLSDDRWREVIINTAGLLSDADEFFEAFLDSITVLMSKSDKAKQLFAWASKKVETQSYPQIDTQLVITFELLAETLFIYPPINNEPTREIYWNLIEVLAISRDKSLGYAQVLDETSNYRTIDAVQKMDLRKARDFMRAFARVHDTNIDLALFRNIEKRNIKLFLKASVVLSSLDTLCIHSSPSTVLKSVKKLWKDFLADLKANKVDDLHNHLLRVEMPSIDSRAEVWRNVSESVRKVISDNFGAYYKWDLNDQDLKCISDVLYSSKLLLECLEVAIVSPLIRDRIQTEILRVK